MERCFPGIVGDIEFRAVLQQKPHDLGLSGVGRQQSVGSRR